jgi:hypothetical protein
VFRFFCLVFFLPLFFSFMGSFFFRHFGVGGAARVSNWRIFTGMFLSCFFFACMNGRGRNEGNMGGYKGIGRGLSVYLFFCALLCRSRKGSVLALSWGEMAFFPFFLVYLWACRCGRGIVVLLYNFEGRCSYELKFFIPCFESAGS